jgi:hypothetical protein
LVDLLKVGTVMGLGIGEADWMLRAVGTKIAIRRDANNIAVNKIGIRYLETVFANMSSRKEKVLGNENNESKVANLRGF